MNFKLFTPSWVAAFSTLAICASPAHAAPGDPVRGGTVVIPIHVGEPATYDCHATNSPAVMWRVSPHYSTLLKVNAERSPEVMGGSGQKLDGLQ